MRDKDWSGPDPNNPTDPSERIRLLQLVAGCHNQASFCRFLGIDDSRLTTYRSGQPFGPTMVAILMKKFPGLPAGWIRYGETGALTMHWARQLERAGADLARLKTRQSLKSVCI